MSKQDSEKMGKLFFPPDSAPETVKKAYESLSEEDQREVSHLAFLMHINANTRRDASGRVYTLKRGEEGYVNIFEREGFTYTKFVDEMMDYVELGKKYKTHDQYKRQINALSKFKECCSPLTSP